MVSGKKIIKGISTLYFTRLNKICSMTLKSTVIVCHTFTITILINPFFFKMIACPKIENCLEMHCHENASSTICANCDGVVLDLPYHQAYILSNNSKQCQRKLSFKC